MELSSFYVDEIRQKFGIHVVLANFLTYIPAPGERYDVITFCHVLEHLPVPLKAIRKIHSFLTGGRL